MHIMYRYALLLLPFGLTAVRIIASSSDSRTSTHVICSALSVSPIKEGIEVVGYWIQYATYYWWLLCTADVIRGIITIERNSGTSTIAST